MDMDMDKGVSSLSVIDICVSTSSGQNTYIGKELTSGIGAIKNSNGSKPKIPCISIG